MSHKLRRHTTAFTYNNEDLEGIWYTLAYGDTYSSIDASGNFNLEIDDISFEVGVLKLYKNNGYKYGYLKIEHNCSGDVPATYSKVSCSLI